MISFLIKDQKKKVKSERVLRERKRDLFEEDEAIRGAELGVEVERARGVETAPGEVIFLARGSGFVVIGLLTHHCTRL